MRRPREEELSGTRRIAAVHAASTPADQVETREARQRKLFHAIRVVNDESASLRGELFFDSLTERLADVLGADAVFVGQLGFDGGTMEIVSMRTNGRKAFPFSYALAGTPCEQVVANRTRSYSKDVLHLFPDDTVLVEMGIHGYVGVPLRDAAGASIGILVGLFRHELYHPEFAESVLLFFAPRAALEIQQARAEEIIQQRDQALEAALDEARRANASKDRLLAKLSRELRAPVALDAGRILLVEDDADTRETLTASLEMLGHSVVSCATGVEALGRVFGARADVILADIGLPDIDGCDLLKRMRDVAGCETVPAVAVTALGQPEDRRRTREAGFIEHMVKPVELRTLAARVQALVAQQRAARAS